MLGTILIVAGLVLIAGAIVAWPFVSRSSRRTAESAAADDAPQPEPSSPRSTTPRRQPRRQPFFLRPPIMIGGAVLCVVLGVGAGVLLPRLLAPGTPAGVTQAGADLEAMEQELKTTPNDIPKLLFYAHAALDQGQLTRAIPAYKHVLKLDPKNVEAIVHFGSILYQAGHVEQALAEIDKALAIDGKYAHAYWDKAHVLFDGKRDYAGAQKALQAFLELIPSGSDADRARALMDEAKRLALAPPPPATNPAAMPLGSATASGEKR